MKGEALAQECLFFDRSEGLPYFVPGIWVEKKLKKMKKNLAIQKNIVYTNSRCDMIAMKREVAARERVFRGANVKLGN